MKKEINTVSSDAVSNEKLEKLPFVALLRANDYLIMPEIYS